MMMPQPPTFGMNKQYSILRARRPYLKRRRGQRRTIRRNRRCDTQTRQAAPDYASRKIQKWLHSRLAIRIPSQGHVPRRRYQLRLHSRVVLLGIETHPAKRFERVISQHVDAAMVCL
jgi:hypothetical protein